MTYTEQALGFACQGEQLFGVLSLPEQPESRAILVVVGGPQYRSGSHRQFTLLARSWAAQGIAVLRFDYRGMGDSSGAMRTFESVGDDLRAATDQLFEHVPGLRDVVIWGLCDAASAAMFYGGQDQRVAGMVLVNPWARTSGGIAKATLKHYYLARLTEPALWKKIAGGQFRLGAALSSFAAQLRAAFGPASPRAAPAAPAQGAPAADPATLPARMLAGLSRFEGKLMLVISEPDLTAREFLDMVAGSRKWQALLSGARVREHRMPDADHTFSRRAWRDQVAAWTADWVRSW